MSLQTLLQSGRIWRAGAREASLPGERLVPSGHTVLDQALGGWPRGAVVELLGADAGSGGLNLMLPLASDLSRAGRWVVLVNPPHVPYAPAWAGQGVDMARLLWVRCPPEQAVWALEQSLRAPACGAALGWCEPLDGRAVRRLQLAAEDSDALAFLFRAAAAARQSSPAALRLALEGGPEGPRITVLKRRGGRTGQRLVMGRY